MRRDSMQTPKDQIRKYFVCYISDVKKQMGGEQEGQEARAEDGVEVDEKQ